MPMPSRLLPALLIMGTLSSGDDDAATRGRAWLQALRGTPDAAHAAVLGLRAAADDPAAVDAVMEDLLADTALAIDPVRIALRLETINADVISLAPRVAAARRLISACGPRLPDRQVRSLTSAASGTDHELKQLSLLAPYVLRILPDAARRTIEALLGQTPPDPQAVTAALMEPGAVEDASVIDHLDRAARLPSADPALVALAALLTGKRDHGAKMLVTYGRTAQDSALAVQAIEMLPILRLEPPMADLLDSVRLRPGLATAAYRVCRDGGASATMYLATCLDDQNPALRVIAARVLCVDSPVRGEAWTPVTRLATNKDAQLRELAAFGLGRFGQSGFPASRILARLSVDEDEGVRWAALGAASLAYPDDALRRAIRGAAQTRDRLAVEAMKALFFWDDESLEPIMRAHVLEGGPTSDITEMATQRGWDDVLRMCRARMTTAVGDRDASAAVIAAIVRATGTSGKETYVRQLGMLSNRGLLSAARRWCEAGGDTLPVDVLAEIERRAWQWGDSPVDEMTNRIDALVVLSRCGRITGSRLASAVMRMFAVLSAEEDGDFYIDDWLALAQRLDDGLLPMWYFARMARNPAIHAETRRACRRLAGT